jgi:hypothetical protein
MVVFQDIQDVEEWLKPLDYLAFWKAVAPYHLVLQDRDHCDGQIACGIVGAELVLEVLKILAVVELQVAFNLPCRVHEPVAAKYLQRVH